MIITNNVMEHHLAIQMVLHIFFLQAFLDSYLVTNPYTPYATSDPYNKALPSTIKTTYPLIPLTNQQPFSCTWHTFACVI